MNKQKEELIERMNNLKKLIPDTIEAVKELPDFDFYTLSSVNDPGELQINITEYNYIEYLKLRRVLARNYTYLRHWFHGTLGSFFVELRHKKLDVELDIQLKISKDGIASMEEGTTCKLVVDHYTSPEPVYRVECK